MMSKENGPDHRANGEQGQTTKSFDTADSTTTTGGEKPDIETRIAEARDAGLVNDDGRHVDDNHFAWGEPPEGFSYSDDAVHAILQNRMGESYSQKIAGPVWVSAHKAGQDGGLFIEISFRDKDGKTRRVDMARGDLSRSDDVVKRLLKEGADVDPTQGRYVARYLAACNPTTRLGKESSPNASLNLSAAIMNFNALMTADIPERKLILPWLPEGGLAMVYAPRGLGKTFFGISLAVAVVEGSPFMKWQVTKPCSVLYIDGEMPLGAYRTRATGFIQRKDQSNEHG